MAELGTRSTAKPALAQRWLGSLRIGIGNASYVGPAGDTAEHAHHAVQVCVALKGRVEVLCDGKPIRAAGLVIGSDVRHRLVSGAGRLVLVYLEPETADGRRLLARGDPIAPLDPPLVHSLVPIARAIAKSSGTRAERGGHCDVVARLARGAFDSTRMDRRLVRAIKLARSNPAQYATVSTLATAVGLSPSRFRELFARGSSISCRRYLMWVRLQRAMVVVAAGESLTTAAHAAGFADSAHFTRVFRAMFGVAPFTLSRGVRFLTD